MLPTLIHLPDQNWKVKESGMVGLITAFTMFLDSVAQEAHTHGVGLNKVTSLNENSGHQHYSV